MAPKQKVVAKKRTFRPAPGQSFVPPYGSSSGSQDPRHSVPASEQAVPRRDSPAGAYGIRFRDDVHENRCNAVLRRQIINTRFLDPHTMMRLGLYEDIEWMFGNIGWNSFFSLQHPTFIPLALEFFGSLSVEVNNHDDRDAGKISFRLGGLDHVLTLQQVNQLFGFPEDGTRLVPREFHANTFWSQITRDHVYEAKVARASLLSNPVFRYVHRFFAHTIFGRGESDGMVRVHEVFFLWAMLHSYKINTAFYLVKQLIKMATAPKGAIVMGGLITQIALVLGIDPSAMERARGNPRIDLDSCLSMKFIVKEGDVYSLIFRGSDQRMVLPCQPRTTVRDNGNWRISPPEAADVPPPLNTELPPHFGGFSGPRDFPGSSAPGGSSSSSFSSMEAMLKQIIEVQQTHGELLTNIEHNQSYLRQDLSRRCDEHRQIIAEQRRQGKFLSHMWQSFGELKETIKKGFQEDDDEEIKGDGDDDEEDEPHNISSDDAQESGAEMSSDDGDDN